MIGVFSDWIFEYLFGFVIFGNIYLKPIEPKNKEIFIGVFDEKIIITIALVITL